MMKNTLSAELNCQVDVEKIRGLSICLWDIESLPAVCWVFYSFFLIMYSSQAETNTWELIAI